MPTQPGHPSVGRQNDYWRLAVTATAGEETGEFCVAVGPVTRTADVVGYRRWMLILGYLRHCFMELGTRMGRTGRQTDGQTDG